MRNDVYKVLPNEYDNSISYYEVLTKVVEKLNILVDKLNNAKSSTDVAYNTENERIIFYEKEII